MSVAAQGRGPSPGPLDCAVDACPRRRLYWAFSLMPRRLDISLARTPAMWAHRVTLGTLKLVYIITADKLLHEAVLTS